MVARDGASERAVRAVLASIETGPYETELLVPRLDLLFEARNYLGSEADPLLYDQIRVAWKRQPRNVVLAVRRHGAGDIVRRALEREPALVRNVDDYFRDPNIR
jgi:hypothetical protein